MRYTTYRYNTQTCQYERVKVSAKNIAWFLLGMAVTASSMLAGILLLHDLLVNTPDEKRLRKENQALRQHHAALSGRLNDLQPVLTSLQNKDRILHARFFGSSLAVGELEADGASKEKLLLADDNSFREHVSSIKQTSQRLIGRSVATREYFSNKLEIKKEDLEHIGALPTLQPVIPWQDDRLISGFGMRVNPFHKGLYEHLGIDVALPRGTPVIATAPGVIVQLKRSDLQAGYGNYIEIDHGNEVVTRYAHLENINVRFGEKIAKGQAVATIGSSGGSVAPHLHYEILRNGKNVDPVYYLVEGLTSERHDRLVKTSHQQNQSLD
jgi:murein DD-endopeptidase MepM/ murein hydrolase activator NlpD